MARQKEKQLHWITFSGASSHESLNALWLCLRTGKMQLKTLSAIQDQEDGRGENDLEISNLRALLKMHGQDVPVRSVGCDFGDPSGFVQTFSELLDAGSKRDGNIIVNLPPTLPSHIPALAAQVAGKNSDATLLYLHCAEPSLREAPLALIPRPALQLFCLEGGKSQTWKLPEREPAPAGADSIRQTWHLYSGEVLLLVNALLDLGYDRNLSIRLPLLKGLSLCRLHFKKEGVSITDFIQRKEYNKRVHQLPKSLSVRARRQIPDYNQLIQLFYAAGVLRPSGLTGLIEEMLTMASRPLDKGGDVYHIALDTNLLRDRFFSTCLGGLCFPPNVDFVLCETVRSELMNRQEKINDAFLDDMAPLDRDLAAELFFNQNQLEDRLRYIGLLEFNRMKAATGCHEQDAGSANSSGRNDRYILDAYSSFVGVGCKVIFLSRDQETVRMMRGEESVVSFLLEQKESPEEEFVVDWKALMGLLYLWAVAYGRLELVVGGAPVAAVDGVWAGKSVGQWEEDCARVKVIRPRNSQDMEDYRSLADGIERDYAVLMGLGAR
jgi:hypothetical protein